VTDFASAVAQEPPSAEAVVKALLPIRFVKLRVVIEPAESLSLPAYKGSALRGAFGVAFKQAICVAEPEQRECSSCLLRFGCPYPYVFDTPTALLGSSVRGHTAAPHPFILIPPLDARQSYEVGDALSFEFVVIGDLATRLVPYFIYVFEWMGRRTGLGKGRGRFRLQRVDQLGREGWHTIYTWRQSQLEAPVRPRDVSDLLDSACATGCPTSTEPDDELTQLRLRFLTPCRLVRNDRLVERPEFEVLTRALLRRFDDLARYHCGGPLRLDFAGLVALASTVELRQHSVSWYDWERYSRRQDARMKLGGFVGEVLYVGRVAPFRPLLRLGEILHVGKNTSFGLGKFVMEGG
jgi:hypothetical protein